MIRANPNLVRQLFKDDMQLVQQRAKLIAGAKMPVAGLSIAVMYNAPNTTMSSVLAAQTADTLITIDGLVFLSLVQVSSGSFLCHFARQQEVTAIALCSFYDIAFFA